jgi:NTP pyrophosphatase (non-canonical NTP hydrolase)
MKDGYEAGELLECFQWGPCTDKKALQEELADVMNYCIQLAQKEGFDICEILNDKIDKNEKKYPVDKSRGVSTKYDKL